MMGRILAKLLVKLIRREEGMEMVEWAILAVVFAVAAAAFWTDLATSIDNALGQIEAVIDPS